MSQYPPPSSPQQPTYGGYPEPQPPPQTPEALLAHARRAGTMMIAVGAMAVVCGLFLAYQASKFDIDQLSSSPELKRETELQIQWFEGQSGMTYHTLTLIVAFVPLAVGALVGGIGFYVRSGSLSWTIIGTVVVGAMALVTAMGLLFGVILGAAGAPAIAVASVCEFSVPLALLVTLFVWLIQAARATAKVSQARKQYEAQLWQYRQYQQAYLQNTAEHPPPAQQGLGYGYPPPGQPTPPPADASAERKEPPGGAPPQG